jgi:hypothetical protein
VGFYGGINYGFGYGGVGFAGGEWRGGSFFYNRAVMNVNVREVTNVYNRTVVVNNVHTSFNGPGGIEARPTAEEERYSHEQHTPALAAQTEHEHSASQNKALFASENHGRPAIAATARPGEFSGHGVVRAAAAGAAYHAAKMSPAEARASGNREAGRNEPARNEGGRNAESSNERKAERPENREAHNNMVRANEEGRASEARGNNEARGKEGRVNNEERGSAGRNGAAHNNGGGNREAKAAHANPKPAKQEKQAPKRAQKPAKAEPKRNR